LTSGQRSSSSIRHHMHQQPAQAPFGPNKFSRDGQRSGLSSRISNSSVCGFELTVQSFRAQRVLGIGDTRGLPNAMVDGKNGGNALPSASWQPARNLFCPNAVLVTSDQSPGRPVASAVANGLPSTPKEIG